jgi:Na+/melibiose symporter-like transporter
MSKVRTMSLVVGAAGLAVIAFATPALAQTTTSSGGPNYGVYLIGGVIFAIACGFIANTKNRNVVLWVVLGFLFGLISLIIIAVLKKKQPEISYGTGGGYGSPPPPPPPPPAP